MKDNEYVVVDHLSNIVYNCSQSVTSATKSKNIILDSLVGIIKEYNKRNPNQEIKIVDFRKNEKNEDKYKKIEELKEIIKNVENDSSVKLYRTAKSLLKQIED